MSVSPLSESSAHRRLEGRDKVTGAARYTGDFGFGQIGRTLLHAAVVQSRIGAGYIHSIDTTQAEQAPGVHAVLTYLNAPRLQPVKTFSSSELDCLLPLQDECIHYNGQPVAVVVADTLLEAQHAAALIKVSYGHDADPCFSFEREIPRATPVKKVAAGQPAEQKRGYPEPAFHSAPLQLDLQYRTMSAHHNPLEPGASLAVWEANGELNVWNSTQFSYGDATNLGQAFGFGMRDRKPRLLPEFLVGWKLESKIRVIAPLVGGGFGSKGSSAGLLLAAMAAKAVGQAVKLVLTREQMFAMMPYRSALLQRVRIGATASGQILALLHDGVIQNSVVGTFVEPVGEMTSHLYSCDHLRTTHSITKLNTNAPGWMRAPGAAPGVFAVECAMDELAEKVGLDPVDLRLRNYAEVDPATGHKWSSKSLKECYRLAGEQIGWWSERDPRPCSMREGNFLIGFGMATAAYNTQQFPANARVTLRSNGHAIVQTAVHEIGQGAITALTQIAAETLGLPLDYVHLEYGDTELPFAPITAGSATTLSVGSAIKEAAYRVRRDLILRAITDKASPLYKLRPRDVTFEKGNLIAVQNPSRSEPVTALLARYPLRTFSAKAVTGRTFGKSRYGRSAFGAQFVKVAIDAETGQIQVRRLAGAFGCGRIINPVIARSQLLGGMVWGIGHALLEETVMDKSNGRWVNSNLAEALVPTNSDAQQIEAFLIEEDDRRGSALGAKGIGEIGITGVAAAIANAVYHATGQRIRELPIRLDKLLAAHTQ